MNNILTANVFRFFGLLLAQGLVFQNIGVDWGDFPYLRIIIYPIFILLLPFRAPRSLVIFLSFLLGLFVDIFYNTIGVHASAATFTAFARPYILKFFEPRGGYNTNYSPTVYRYEINWFFKYAATMMLAHLFFYFSVEAFTFVYIVDILGKTVVSFIFSLSFVMIYQLIFNPVE